MSGLQACRDCLVLSGSLLLWEVAVAQGTTRQYQGQVDFFLGTSAELDARSSNCASCLSIQGCQSHADIEEKHGKVYGVSVHFRIKQPLFYIARGNLDTMSSDPSQRRAQLIDLRLEMLLSTNPMLSKSATGRGRPYDMEGYNSSLVRRWIERCDKHHQSTCVERLKSIPLFKAKLSFIDVEELCIVTPDEPVRYGALSYVWGEDVFPTAKTANITLLKIPGAFLKGGFMELPATIHDAVRLCANIGIRYLWVDSLCIVQDDMDSKMQQIKAMSSVYANAYLTFVALTSEAANSGVPRMSQGKPSSKASPFLRLPCQLLVNASQGAHGLAPVVHARTAWTKRAWTLQETVLSKRLLCLGPVASWACAGADWVEDLELPSEFDGQPAFTEEKTKYSIPQWPDMSQYSSLATAYAARRMTLSADTVNAFEGVMAPIGQHLPGQFLFGVPEFMFDIGLLWQYRRRGAKPRSGVDWAEAKHDYPSWSWISHHGIHLQNLWSADYAYPRPDLYISPLVRWKKQNRDTGDWEDIENSYHLVRQRYEKPDTATPENWTRHTNEPEPPYYQSSLFNHVDPQPKFSYPIPTQCEHSNESPASFHPHLLFEGSLARVRFQFPGTAEERDSRNEKLLEDGSVPELEIVEAVNGAWVGRIRLNLQPGSKLPEDDEEQEVIAISGGRIAMTAAREHSFTTEAKERDEINSADASYEFVNVLWIGRTNDNKVYRKALGRIWLEAWQKMNAEKVSLLLT
ncbi:hypothetical protein PWT90_07262 [Aphanocladium album]|nr:hypothetical protein PWT90_07262 [Aphanocladium album]